MFHLPKHIINKIFEYDSTYREIYKKVLYQIEVFPVWNIKNINDELATIHYYYPFKIAYDMMSHWNKYHYTYYIDTLVSNSHENSTKELVNFLDNNAINNNIPGVKKTLFKWIKFYNDISTR